MEDHYDDKCFEVYKGKTIRNFRCRQYHMERRGDEYFEEVKEIDQEYEKTPTI